MGQPQSNDGGDGGGVSTLTIVVDEAVVRGLDDQHCPVSGQLDWDHDVMGESGGVVGYAEVLKV